MEPAINQEKAQDERIKAVKEIFNTITPNYDFLNRLMSARQDVRWREFVIKQIPEHAREILDVATGTGDLAIGIALSKPSANVWGVDFVEKMMRVAQVKTGRHNLTTRIIYIAGDALKLPFPDNRFDAATMAFGLRNILDRSAALREMTRVVKPGGKVFILEMTFPRSLKMRSFFRWYLNSVIPFVGGLISGNRQAYRYLPDSIQEFLHPDELAELFYEAGLKMVKSFPLTFGLTYLHEGCVP